MSSLRMKTSPVTATFPIPSASLTNTAKSSEVWPGTRMTVTEGDN